MDYIVSARKYRPSNFESVVGQSNITQTLRNAIKINHLAQAYLFCGPRGVGKTTCARIFAKTINCLNPTAEHDACNECESCVAFNEQRSFNIHELDAASNNSVDDIRKLIDQVRIPPQIGKYSVYIIDEVHMLSKDAFNALLKTLEEPPSYAIFILATTEKSKILPTILSRCQVFDFQRITLRDIVGQLQYISSKEGVSAEIEALNVIAQKADGALRDALSIYDQVVSYCGQMVTYEKTIELLNVLDVEYYFRAVDALLVNDYIQLLLLFDNVLAKGFDAQNFVIGLATHLRNVLMSKDAITVKLIDAPEKVQQHYADQATKCSAKMILSALNIVNDTDIQMRYAKNPRLSVELMLLRLSQLTLPQEAVAPSNVPSTAPSKVPSTAPSTAPSKVPSIAQPAASKPAAQAQVINTVPTAPKIPTISIRTNPAPNQPSAQAAVVTASAPISNPAQQAIELNMPITQQGLEEAWLTLPKLFNQDDRLHNTLINARPQLVGENQIVIHVDNKLQEPLVMQVRQQLQSNLAQRLKNTHIQLTCEVAPVQQSNTASSQERLKNLNTINPELKNLATSLQLEII